MQRSNSGCYRSSVKMQGERRSTCRVEFLIHCNIDDGRVAKLLGCLIAEQNIDGVNRTLGSQVGCSSTIHPAANRYLVATLGKLEAARKGTGHPTSLCRRLRISVPPTGTPPMYGIVRHLYLTLTLPLMMMLRNAEMSYASKCSIHLQDMTYNLLQHEEETQDVRK